MRNGLKVRFRIDFGPKCSLGIGKIELLEAIDKSGSLSQAARRMHMSYRRAWLLLTDMNSSFHEAVATTSTGGRGGGGAVLTTLGRRLVGEYRQMESALGTIATVHFADIGRRLKPKKANDLVKSSTHVISIRRNCKRAER